MSFEFMFALTASTSHQRFRFSLTSSSSHGGIGVRIHLFDLVSAQI